jgi:catechol-2,3-dioxygenase
MSFPSQKATVVAQPLIAVRNVRASSRWYAKLLGADSLPEHSHRDLYERISCSGQLLLQLHAWDEETIPTSSTQTRHRLDTVSCCGSR